MDSPALLCSILSMPLHKYFITCSLINVFVSWECQRRRNGLQLCFVRQASRANSRIGRGAAEMGYGARKRKSRAQVWVYPVPCRKFMKISNTPENKNKRQEIIIFQVELVLGVVIFLCDHSTLNLLTSQLLLAKYTVIYSTRSLVLSKAKHLNPSAEDCSSNRQITTAEQN